MQLCEVVKLRSTCAKVKTATIICDEEKNVISIGYNGVNAGREHCENYWHRISEGKPFLEIEDIMTRHREWSTKNEIHAEMNAIIKLGKKSENLILYTILSPCINCAKLIVACKIKKVFYKTIYDDFSGIEFLLANDVSVVRLE
jgi:dCMP deaminase